MKTWAKTANKFLRWKLYSMRRHPSLCCQQCPSKAFCPQASGFYNRDLPLLSFRLAWQQQEAPAVHFPFKTRRTLPGTNAYYLFAPVSRRRRCCKVYICFWIKKKKEDNWQEKLWRIMRRVSCSLSFRLQLACSYQSRIYQTGKSWVLFYCFIVKLNFMFVAKWTVIILQH